MAIVVRGRPAPSRSRGAMETSLLPMDPAVGIERDVWPTRLVAMTRPPTPKNVISRNSGKSKIREYFRLLPRFHVGAAQDQPHSAQHARVVLHVLADLFRDLIRQPSVTFPDCRFRSLLQVANGDDSVEQQRRDGCARNQENEPVRDSSHLGLAACH